MEATDHKLSAWVPTVHFLSRLRSSHYHFSFRSQINKYLTCCRATWNIFVNLTSQMTLKCGKNKIEKDVFRLVTSVGQRKNSESLRGIEPQTFGFRDPMLYFWATDSTVSEVYYEVITTRILHTAKISNVDSVMFVYRIREMVSFEPCRKRCFSSSNERGTKKKFWALMRNQTADPSSMQEACHMNFVIDLVHRGVSVAQW